VHFWGQFGHPKVGSLLQPRAIHEDPNRLGAWSEQECVQVDPEANFRERQIATRTDEKLLVGAWMSRKHRWSG
jgi:hypothetical protein